MLNFDKLLASFNRSVTEAFGENLVRNGDFSHNRLKDYKKWGTMQDTGDGSWVAEEGRIEVQKASGHGGTPAKYMRSTVLELDALTGLRGLGATESNATLTQQIEEITGPGTYRLSLDYRGAKSSKYGVEDTGTAEIWVGDKLVTVLSQGRPKWEERIIEFTLTEEDIPENGVVDLKLVSTGKADGRGAQLDNISLREIGETGLLGDELVHNGGFEDHPPMNRGRHGVFEQLPGWEVSSDSVIELKSVRKPATPRDKKDAYIELDSHGPGSNSKVVQEIDVPEDGIYLLSFDYSPRGRGSKTEKTSSIKVMAGDQVIAELSSDEVGWKPFTFNVDLVEGPLKLSFEGTGTQDTIGGLLDNVELRKVADLGPGPDPVNTALDVPDDPEEAGHGYASGLLGEVYFADAVLTRLDQALSHVDDTPDATFVATEIDYGNHTGWFHNPLAKVLEHDAESLVGHADGALEQNVDHTVMQLTGEVYLEAGKHRFFNRTDDGFRLTIDGQEVAEFEGLRPARTTQGAIEVAEDGWYDIAVDYFEWKGHSKLRIEHRAPDGKREILDDDRLRHKTEDENAAPIAVGDAATTAEDTPVILDLLANDSDPDGDALGIVDLGPVENGELTLNADGTVTFTPDADFNGTVSFDYTISDGQAESTATATIEVTPVNDHPVASSDFGETEGTDSVTIDVLANDSDVDGDTLFIVDVGDSADGTIDLLSDGTLTFTANHGFAGTTSFLYTISDGAATDTAEVTIDVSPANRPPDPADDFVETDEDMPVSFDPLANDSDLDGDALTIVDLGPVENGALDLNSDGSVTFSPDADYNGTVSFDYTVSDGQTQSTATATVEVLPVNDPATAGEDSASTLEDTPVTMNLLANDADVDGDVLSIVDLGPVENGALALNPDGTVTFTPDADFNGSVSFDYTISDGVDLSTGAATVEVIPVNDPLSAEDDWARVDEDRAISLNLTLNDRDVDRDDLFVVDLGPVENGTASLNPTGTVTFTPDADFHGTASFVYTVSDGVFESSATVTIEVTPINDHPVAHADFGQTEGAAPVILNVLANDSDVEGDALIIVDPGTSPDGTIELLSDGTIAFTANEGFVGTTTFVYTVGDGAATDTAEVTIEVLQQNRPPEPENDVVTMAEDTSITVDLLANDGDPDGDPLTITAFGPFLNGSLTNHGDGTVSFTPDADYAGYIVIGYTVADDEGLTGAAQLHIAVENVNDAPVAVADAVGMDRGDTVMVNVLANDIDIDSVGLELVSASSARGSVSIVDGRIIFDPLDDFAFLAVEESADEVISYTIRDDEGAEALGTLTVTVTAPRQDRVNESLSYTERGAGGNTTDLDGEAGFQAIGFVGLAGFDNNDRLSIDLDSRGGLGRSSARGDHGDDEDAGPGGDGTGAMVAGGLGGGASAELFNAFLTGNEYDDRLDVVVDAFAGRGGKGGDGGDGGDASPLGMHTVRQFGGGEITTDYGEGAAFDGGDGGDGADGANGGDAHATVRNGAFDGGDDDDDITVEVEAVAGNGGNGGGGGRAGDGGNDRPFGGSHVNESISGNGGSGGHGGDSFAEVDGAQMLGGSGDDRIELVVVSEAGKGGIGGQGGRSGEGQYLDTIFTNNGLFLPPEYEGELFAILGAAGDGGDSGDNGNAQAVVTGNLLDGGDGDDEILLEIIAETPDAVSGASAGNSGIDGTLTPQQTGDYTVHQIAGIVGAAGADGAAGSATIIATGNTITGGSGDDVIEVVTEAITQGTATLTFEGNTIDGGAGQDIADFSKFDVAMDVDLAAGTFTAGTGAGSNAIDSIEHLIATIYDDVVSGSGSAETLTGGEGSDTLAGGGGQDIFVFDEGDGTDTIEDFSDDVIDLTSHTGALDFVGLDVSDTTEGALIAFATGDTILLRGIDADQLAETNFAF